MTATPAPAPKPARRRPAVWFGGGLTLLLAVLLLALVLLLAALHSERGSRWLWQFATLASSGRLAGEYAGGTLADGFQLRALRYHDGELELTLDRFDGRWNLHRAPLTLDVEALRLGTLHLQLPPPGPPSPPPQLPAALRLPLAFRLGELALEHLEVSGRGAPIVIERLRLHGASDGSHHSLTLETVDTPYGRASARAELDGAAPFATSGGLDLAGSRDGNDYHVAGHWNGTLEALELGLDASGGQLAGQAQIGLAPFAPQPLLRARISADHLDPQRFAAGAPAADISLRADLAPEQGSSADAAMTVAGSISLRNTIPGALDAGRVPFKSADATVRLNAERQELQRLDVRLAGDALLSGSGALQQAEAGGSGSFRLQAQGLDLHALHARLQPTRLAGPLTVQLQPGAQQLELALADARYRLQLDAGLDASRIELRRAELQAGPAQLQASGTLARDTGMAYAFNGKLREFDPAQWLVSAPAKGAPASRVPPARINLDFDVAGALAPQLQVKLKFGLHDSSYDQLPLAGGGTLNLAGQRLLPSTLELEVAGNRLNADGSFGAAGDRLRLHLDAPRLQRLGYGLDGLLQLDGELAGSLQRPRIDARYRAEKLAFGEHRLAAASGHAELEGALQDLLAGKAGKPDAEPLLRLDVDVEADGYRGPGVALQRFSARLVGDDRQHQFSASADGKLRGQPLALALAAHGGLTPQPDGLRWDGSIDTLENRGQPHFALEAPLPLSAGPGQLRLGAARLTLSEAVLELQQLVWDHGQLRSEGSVSALAVARVLELARQFGGVEVPLQSDLVLDGDWNLEFGQHATGFARIVRRGGDLRVDSGRGAGALGLEALELRADLQPDGLKLAVQTRATHIGSIDAQVTAGWSHADGMLTLAPQAPLAGQVTLRVPELKAVAALAGPELALDGSVAADLALSGTLETPQWSGELAGDRLALTLFDLGIQLRDGVVRIGLSRDEIDLRQIEFHGGEGTLRASGRFHLSDADPTLAATIVADHLQLFASPDRRLTISGQARIAHDQQHLRVDGKVTADQGLFDLPKKSAPQLDDDVVVVRRDGKRTAPQPRPIGSSHEKPAGRWAPLINIEFDLGHDFHFRGSGADLLLRGGMTVHSEPLQPLRADGTIRVAEGTYEAFGRKLGIERGLINFQGAIDNPNINILAMRRNQDVEAGVEVTGFANQPRVRLVSEPSVADEEKLSWLMFGHGSDSSGLGQQQAASAALALLGNAGGKRIAQGIGLDEFSIGASESGLADQQVVNLGKAISENFFVGYEQSLTGAASIVKMTWQLSRRWSLVARAGAISGLDILFNRRYD